MSSHALEERIELRKTARLRMAQARACMRLATEDTSPPSTVEHYLWETIERMIEATESLTSALEIEENNE